MIGRSSKFDSAVSINDVEEILGKRKDLTYEQQLALDHAKKFAVPKAKYESARKALKELDLMDDSTIASVLSVLPKSEMGLKQIMAGSKKPLKDDEVAKVFDIVKKVSV